MPAAKTEPESTAAQQGAARLAKLLRDYRAQHGLTQTDFAALAGVIKQNISAYERGVVKPTLSIVSQLAQALEMEPNDIAQLYGAWHPTRASPRTSDPVLVDLILAYERASPELRNSVKPTLALVLENLQHHD